MIRLNSKDASILARVAQYENLPLAKRQQMLDDATEDAQEVGRVLLGHPSDSSDAKALATIIKNWVAGNRSQRTYRKKLSRVYQLAAHPLF